MTPNIYRFPGPPPIHIPPPCDVEELFKLAEHRLQKAETDRARCITFIASTLWLTLLGLYVVLHAVFA
jgi:hypothetical protein